ncbi:SET domain-containing protein 9-like isoform X2 [Mizuhopecten yessoensis]|uniref:SET domain-containing protein 9-like isoform X2 n=1 Tax=Mizuhopecten yessoensis TaxID=6573 RepID=UPI000B45C826|nr:SET domain-containing protein 9-like isoform X2 [Mizuhopecten yessoensis]
MSVRSVAPSEKDKLFNDSQVEQFLLHFFENLEKVRQSNAQTSDDGDLWKPQKLTKEEQYLQHRNNLRMMEDCVGFIVERKQSLIPGGGTGVFVTKGQVPKGTVVSMYPGTLYRLGEPILLQSLANPFIFRCIDAVLIDGNDKNISKSIYISCGQRDRHGPYLTCDLSWVTQYPINPLAVGQYVNNQSKLFPANVAYQEFDIPLQFPFHLRKYIPNINYSSSIQEISGQHRQTRVVVLVSLRTIEEGEELFSSYFTVVH